MSMLLEVVVELSDLEKKKKNKPVNWFGQEDNEKLLWYPR